MTLQRRPLCSSRHPEFTFIKCEREPHEAGDHKAEGAFGKWWTWPNGKVARTQQKRKGSGPRPISDKQAIRNAFLMGVKAERLREMFFMYGEARCEKCKDFLGPEPMGEDEPEWIERAMAVVDQHHKDGRALPYKAWNNHGTDSPHYLELLCRRCHDQEGSNPQWGGAA